MKDKTLPQINHLDRAVVLAKVFIDKAKVAKKKLAEDPYYSIGGCKETAAAKRASMDLTRALVYVRDPNKKD